jgi:beta-N-acetylhexosaminidase
MPRYGSTRFYAGSVQALWNAVWMDHPRVVFTSFGDPYKLYEMPYVPNYVNTYSNTPSSQRAAVKVWLGEAQARGAVPVDCPGFFSNTTALQDVVSDACH